MQPKQLKTFLTVARLGNFGHAAREVNLAQSSVSDQMQTLEEELGVKLFERSRNGVVLTPAGNILQSYAQEILTLNGEARSAVRAAVELRQETVTIGTLETIAAEKLSGFLSRFQSAHPDILLTLKIGGSGDLQRRLEEGSIDLAITFDRGERDGRFARRLVSHEPLALISGAEAVRSHSPADVGTLPFIVTETGCIYRRLFDTAFAEAGIAQPRIVAQAESITTIIRLVASGSGYGLVPRFAIDAIARRDGIIELPWPGEEPKASLVMVWRRRRVQSPTLSLLLAAATADLRSLRPADARPRRVV